MHLTALLLCPGLAWHATRNLPLRKTLGDDDDGTRFLSAVVVQFIIIIPFGIEFGGIIILGHRNLSNNNRPRTRLLVRPSTRGKRVRFGRSCIDDDITMHVAYAQKIIPFLRDMNYWFGFGSSTFNMCFSLFYPRIVQIRGWLKMMVIIGGWMVGPRCC